ncbi:MAG TPA: peptide ABC transporter ATP-binding protein [Firmicutes bacterium]|nr:peptide ABC transporter ATP-binding protein [Bacillota bacterium]
MKKILDVQNLNITFDTFAGPVCAVRGVSFTLHEGETLAIVGESGSGKSVASKTIMGILADNGKVTEGSIVYTDEQGQEIDLVQIPEKKYHQVRGKEIAMVFQDPMTSLNPTMTIGKQIMEPIMKHQGLSKSEAAEKAKELISLVGIDRPEKRMKQYPHQFSGGMRQRIVIAVALACNPRVLICDEPTTALDVTIQAQILELIKELQQKTNVAVIFITHDLGVVANVADRVAVMYAGRVCEIGTSDEIFYNPCHPYTWGLLASMPDLDTSEELLYAIPGTPPNLLHPPVGDAFALRSEYALKIDLEEQPPMFKVSETHYAATWLLHELAPKVEVPAAVARLRAKGGYVHE